jgi:thiaminase/transcriptional activator TenA
MSLARGLWADNTDLAQAALDHPFVRGLRAGTLPRHHFQAYLAQDAYFLDAFARAYALALAHSPEQQGRRAFFELLAGVFEELRLHEGYAARWEVHLSSVTPMKATQAHTDFLLATAALQGVGETCAAMTPCMRLYAFLGQSLAADHPDETHPYVEWIRTYADPSFEALAVRLENLLDRYASATPRVQSVYRRAMALELDFFTAHTPAGR